MFAWMNDNSGALSVIITFVYVLATIFICFFNWRSVKASREQIAASQKQQVQNAGLQLYSLRKEVVSKISKHQFNDVFWDVSLLFDEKLSYEFQDVAFDAGKLEDKYTVIRLFEEELKRQIPNE